MAEGIDTMSVTTATFRDQNHDMSSSVTPGRTSALARLAAIGLACLVAGFVVGWFVRGDGGDAAVLPAATVPSTTTAATTTGATSTGTAPPAPAPLPTRSEVSLAVLNGTTIAGFAGRTAAKATSLGYPNPTAGNTPSVTGPTIVYFRPGKRPSAQRVAQDLGFPSIKALPTTGVVAQNAPAGADVVVVLGPG